MASPFEREYLSRVPALSASLSSPEAAISRPSPHTHRTLRMKNVREAHEKTKRRPVTSPVEQHQTEQQSGRDMTLRFPHRSLVDDKVRATTTLKMTPPVYDHKLYTVCHEENPARPRTDYVVPARDGKPEFHKQFTKLARSVDLVREQRTVGFFSVMFVYANKCVFMRRGTLTSS